ncbi:hypothetical protein [Rhodovibrio salinarum]|uniref:Uncharacterized protein n=1 Tax=Rhodovibrio salinarum TaxID=1087 RepID=A0A934QHQ3_9PROT|nr:hypothetical protein [Rhodovibrio salinarum]MBK1696902.1 hypothetical protein [Rhodovibrio salinarum]
MPISFPVNHAQSDVRSEHSDPWGDLRRYEQAKANGTAPEASFDDLLDVINPLQHLPVVSTIYREITGDTIQGAARVVGGGLYGGVGGFVGGLVNAIAEEATGSDLGEHVMVALGMSEGETPAEEVQVAQAQPQPKAQESKAEESAVPPASPTQTAAQTPTKTQDTAAQEARPAADDAAIAGGGALTGMAALRAFARDTGAAATAAQADQAAATRSRAELQSRQEARATPGRDSMPQADSESRPASNRTAPSSFMPLGDRAALTNMRARTSTAALAAQTDPLGDRRLQGDPRAVPTPAHTSAGTGSTGGESRPSEATSASSQAQTSQTQTSQTQASQPNPAAAAAHGDLAERMMRALEKYETMREAQ